MMLEYTPKPCSTYEDFCSTRPADVALLCTDRKLQIDAESSWNLPEAISAPSLAGRHRV